MTLLGEKVTIIMGDGETVYEGVPTQLNLTQTGGDMSSRATISGGVIAVPTNPTVEVSIDMVCTSLSFNDCSEKTIRDKTVDECTVRELLFAVREKVKNE